MLDLRKTLKIVKTIFEENHIEYAIIGGFALAFYNYDRFTKDIDFLIHHDQVDVFKNKMIANQFKIRFENENVIQFDGIGFVDVIVASKPFSIAMLSESVKGYENLRIARAEAIIGLKIQAYMNDPEREFKDKADIQELLYKNELDLELVKKYAEVFNEWPTIQKILTKKK